MKLNQFAVYRVDQQTAGKALWHLPYQEARQQNVSITVENYRLISIHEMQENEKGINKVVDYLNKLSSAANGFYSSLKSVERIYRSHLEKLEEIEKHKVNWNDFTPEEKLCVENLVLAVGVLYQMCKVQLVLKTSGKQLNQINYSEINKAKKNASEFVNSVND